MSYTKTNFQRVALWKGGTDYLVGSKAIMQLYNTDLIPALSFSETSLFEHPISTGLRHCVANDIHGTAAFKGGDAIGCQGLSNYFDRLVFEAVFMYEAFRSYDATRGSVLHNGTCKRRVNWRS